MNIGVFTLYTPSFQAVADITVPNLQKYCSKQGYGLTVHCGGFDDQTAKIGFQKTDMALSILPGFDVLMVLDIDTFVTNHTVLIEDFLDEEHDFFITKDHRDLNAGSYIVKNTSSGKAFLKAVLGTEVQPEECEQDAMRIVQSECVKILPHPSINSYLYHEYGEDKQHEEGQWEEGDFILHLPGMTNERRIKLLSWIAPKTK